jgi:hypothetical protein
VGKTQHYAHRHQKRFWNFGTRKKNENYQKNNEISRFASCLRLFDGVLRFVADFLLGFADSFPIVV